MEGQDDGPNTYRASALPPSILLVKSLIPVPLWPCSCCAGRPERTVVVQMPNELPIKIDFVSDTALPRHG